MNIPSQIYLREGIVLWGEKGYQKINYAVVN
jgi:hypothetical protein